MNDLKIDEAAQATPVDPNAREELSGSYIAGQKVAYDNCPCTLCEHRKYCTTICDEYARYVQSGRY